MQTSLQGPGNPLPFSIGHFQALPDIPVIGLLVAMRYIHNSFHYFVFRSHLSAPCLLL
jgi:hypothetical protein